LLQAALIAQFAFPFKQAVFHLLWIRNVIGAKSKASGEQAALSPGRKLPSPTEQTLAGR
jgi:hypothetical protein